MLRMLSTEVLDCATRARQLIGNNDPELMAIWDSFERVSIHTTRRRHCMFMQRIDRATWLFTSRPRVTASRS